MKIAQWFLFVGVFLQIIAYAWLVRRPKTGEYGVTDVIRTLFEGLLLYYAGAFSQIF